MWVLVWVLVCSLAAPRVGVSSNQAGVSALWADLSAGSRTSLGSARAQSRVCVPRAWPRSQAPRLCALTAPGCARDRPARARDQHRYRQRPFCATHAWRHSLHLRTRSCGATVSPPTWRAARKFAHRPPRRRLGRARAAVAVGFGAASLRLRPRHRVAASSLATRPPSTTLLRPRRAPGLEPACKAREPRRARPPESSPTSSAHARPRHWAARPHAESRTKRPMATSSRRRARGGGRPRPSVPVCARLCSSTSVRAAHGPPRRAPTHPAPCIVATRALTAQRGRAPSRPLTVPCFLAFSGARRFGHAASPQARLNLRNPTALTGNCARAVPAAPSEPNASKLRCRCPHD